MAEHYFGKVEIQVRFLTRAPRDSTIDITGHSIMDNTKSFYLLNMGSIPVGRTNKYTAGFGEMDIILVFETSGVGSIPTSPAKEVYTYNYENN